MHARAHRECDSARAGMRACARLSELQPLKSPMRDAAAAAGAHSRYTTAPPSRLNPNLRYPCAPRVPVQVPCERCVGNRRECAALGLPLAQIARRRFRFWTHQRELLQAALVLLQQARRGATSAVRVRCGASGAGARLQLAAARDELGPAVLKVRCVRLQALVGRNPVLRPRAARRHVSAAAARAAQPQRGAALPKGGRFKREQR
jgi:hypothetical protein